MNYITTSFPGTLDMLLSVENFQLIRPKKFQYPASRNLPVHIKFNMYLDKLSVDIELAKRWNVVI